MSRSMPLPQALKIAGLVFTLASLGFAAVLVVRHGGDLGARWAELRAAGWRPRAGWLGLAAALGVGNLFLLGGAWIRLMRELGGSLGYVEGMRIWTWTNLGRYLPGKIWQISALTLYLREKKQRGGIGLGSSAVLQVLLLAVGAGVAFAVLGARLAEGRPALALATVALALVGLGLALRPATIGRICRRLSALMGEPWTGSDPGRRELWALAGLMAVSWLLSGLGLWCLWRGVGGPAAPDPLFWTGAFAAAYLIGYVALFAPAGLVVREGALAAILVGLGGVGAPAAAGIAVLSRLWAVATELLATGASWLLPADRPTESEQARSRP